MSRFADVVFPRPLIHSFTYLVPDRFRPLEPGMRVEAPLGQKTVTGFVVRVHDEPPGGAVRLKELVGAPDEGPVFSPATMEFTRRLAAHQVSSWGEILEFALPPREPGPSVRTRSKPPARETARTRPEAAQLALDFTSPGVEAGAAAVAAAIDAGGFARFAALGGPAERKDFYRRAVGAARRRSRSVLVLVPEIEEIEGAAAWAADPGGRPAAMVHGQLTARAKSAAWQAVSKGGAAVVVGSRTALFWPIPDLGLIIVEDEPDEAYLQTENPAFDVRRGARIRAEVEGAVVLFGSDKLSVSAMAKAGGDGTLLELGGSAERRRVAVAGDPSSRALVVPLLAAGLRKCLEEKGRAIVFLNRRGYASVLFCPNCGFIPSCRRCGARPAYHKREDHLLCHDCGTIAPRPASCPRCGRRVFEPRGFGIEALEEEVRRLFPRARVVRFDVDRAARASVQAGILGRFASGRVDVLLGTELLARRANVPAADFVGIVNPEAWLAFPDFTAAERAFQEVSRMLGFALPEAAGGSVVIQTGFPDHYSLRSAARQDYASFYAEEVEFRKALRYPPFSAMAEVGLCGRDPRSLGRKARAFADSLGRGGEGIEVLGPAMASNPGGRGEKRVQVVLRAASPEPITKILGESLAGLGGRWSVARFD
jgi:primosomal protein N' (replication factor Y)